VKEGIYLYKPEGIKLDVYNLEPVHCLCIWGPDAGLSYTGATETQKCWIEDEWQGHVPVHIFDGNPENWELLWFSADRER
jgi:hypothetical protein